ncbi:receptor kinase-like protein Xa21 [Asparagus officinalis]|uniref:receptor kinase-like protein Xa21 n=1 Tax=Asparagus officinalis TaxID=4686 RepID=UPI00098E37D6|nr:receptor kinase-like protein Xa21 [Asparagus officinalis]
MSRLFSACCIAYATALLLSFHRVCSLLNSPTLDNATDMRALLSFKSMISVDPSSQLASWNDSVHFCRWPGVTCGGRRHPERVVSLELSSLNLAGFISASLYNLAFLRRIDLSVNQIRGSIPQDIGRLYQLQHLNLSLNSLGKGIPTSLSRCLDLRVLSLEKNNLEGEIPASLMNLSSLYVLSVGSNQLSGHIPSSIGKLSKLTELGLSSNRLSGDIPASLWNLSSLSYLSMGGNSLSGYLPSDVGFALPLLRSIFFYNNQFHGQIPLSLSNASHLEVVDLSNNLLTGGIPPSLGRLRNLRWLDLFNNQLEAREPDGWRFVTAFSNCTVLEKLRLHSNDLGGMLPSSIANLSTNLQRLEISGNKISGNIPPEIGNLVSLTVLDMGQNLLAGSIPESIGMLKHMHILNLGNNKLSGEIPSTLGNLTQLNILHMGFNELSGIIPQNLGNCRNLILLDLSVNKLTGLIPKEILTIPTLSIYLNLAKNSLTGSIPLEVGILKNLGEIDFSMNKLTGQLPSTLGECQELERLYSCGNFIEGDIPYSLSRLRGLQELDLSQNNLSGKIPHFLQDFPFLYYVNLSFNNLEGEVPRDGVFANTSAVTVLGNKKLCGGSSTLHLRPCTIHSTRKTIHSTRKKIKFVTLAMIVLFATICLSILLLVYWIRKPREEPIRELAYEIGKIASDRAIKPREEPIGELAHERGRKSSAELVRATNKLKRERGRISYAELVRATNGFSEENLIGVGSSGAVYKGILENDTNSMYSGMHIAIKVINLQQRGASKSFVTECDILRNMSHRNILRILTTCSGIDSYGNDFKALVFEHMVNGSLENWLHTVASEERMDAKFNLIQRIEIAIDVASALYYLHHGRENPIIHCDVKPSNILLDHKMTAHVSDFGLARGPVETLIRSSSHTITTFGLRGTVGYVAPEYGTANKVTIKGDVYSYGILLLEMFTGKRPIDDTFQNGMNIRRYVEMAIPEKVLDIMDSRIADKNNARVLEWVAFILKIGLSCSNEFPSRRPEMNNIIHSLHVIRDAFLKQP